MMEKQWVHLLPVVLLVAFSACSPEQSPPAADRFGDDRTVYEAPYDEVVQAASDALFNLGLTIEGGESIDDRTVLINANKSHTAGVGADRVQVATMQVFIHQLAPEITEVRVRMENSKRSGGLVSSGVAGHPTRADYRARLFTELNKQYAIAEMEQVPQEQE